MRQEFKNLTEDAWLALRHDDVTSTQVSALFGCSPYMSEWELYQIKKGTLEDTFQENDRTRWGKRLEAAIAHGVAEDLGLVIEPMKGYVRRPDVRMGSSFDFKIVGLAEGYKGDETYRDLFREHGAGIMEVKNVDGLQFRRTWVDGDDFEAPPHIELQIQHQLEVTGLAWAIGAPLIGGNTPKPFHRLYDPNIGKAIRENIADFWDKFDSGIEPNPDFSRDAAAINRLYINNNGEEADMTDDNYLAELCQEYDEASQEYRDLQKKRDALKAEMLTLIGAYGKVKAAGYNINSGTVRDSPGTLVTPDMVGQYVGGRKGYRMLRLSKAKQTIFS